MPGAGAAHSERYPETERSANSRPHGPTVRPETQKTQGQKARRETAVPGSRPPARVGKTAKWRIAVFQATG